MIKKELRKSILRQFQLSRSISYTFSLDCHKSHLLQIGREKSKHDMANWTGFFPPLLTRNNTSIVRAHQTLTDPPAWSCRIEALEHFGNKILDFTVQIVQKFPSFILTHFTRPSPWLWLCNEFIQHVLKNGFVDILVVWYILVRL